jgi:hypothetical protein
MAGQDMLRKNGQLGRRGALRNNITAPYPQYPISISGDLDMTIAIGLQWHVQHIEQPSWPNTEVQRWLSQTGRLACIGRTPTVMGSKGTAPTGGAGLVPE